MNNNALLIIDVQEAFNNEKWGRRNNPQAEEKMKLVLEQCRSKNWCIIHIQHISQHPDSVFYKHSTSVQFKKEMAPLPTEKVIQKTVNSAFIGTDLEQYLKAENICQLTIMGLTTPHCVSTTARMSGNLGYRTYLLSDATAAFGLYDENGLFIEAETIHRISLATIHDEFATVLDTREFLKSF
ncbi:cysteine hydrolase [Enterococcus saccharolyticus]|uniref:cysteine hydrolase family protein n=1 Tax=Enterococcus TaxID=1350 RepID=UPI001E60C4CE|nr:cysteine hydrolase family protein [Enterococcus saccharolyticus]MCD5003673.1 cysteine hydrolase [Enterococcus saccharolyticus]